MRENHKQAGLYMHHMPGTDQATTVTLRDLEGEAPYSQEIEPEM